MNPILHYRRSLKNPPLSEMIAANQKERQQQRAERRADDEHFARALARELRRAP